MRKCLQNCTEFAAGNGNFTTCSIETGPPSAQQKVLPEVLVGKSDVAGKPRQLVPFFFQGDEK